MFVSVLTVYSLAVSALQLDEPEDRAETVPVVSPALSVFASILPAVFVEDEQELPVVVVRNETSVADW